MKKPVLLTSGGCDRATAYHMSNKVVRHRDGVFVTWLDHEYRVTLAQVNPDSGEVLTSFPLHQGCDNHCGAALAITADQRLHVVAGAHATGGFIYRYSDAPADAGSWSLPESVGSSSTYPSLVALPNGGLVLAYRHTSFTGRWGMMIQRRSPEGDWSWPMVLMWPASERYTFPTNSLVLDAKGILHLGLEFYKTYPPETEESKSVAVTHVYSDDDGITWYHDDERIVSSIPFGIEDAFLVEHDAAGNLRPGNLAVLPDGRMAMGVWNARLGTLAVHVREAPGMWRTSDVTEAATANGDDWRVNSQGRLAVGPDGLLTVVTTVAPSNEWGHPKQHVRGLWLNPESLEVTRNYLVPKDDPERAAWLASVEHSHVQVPEQPLLLLYTDGNRGKGCVNEVRCNVRMLALTADLQD